jgi:hypothetical protein
VEETGEAGVEEIGPSHPSGIGSGAEGSGLNVEARSGAGVDDGAGVSGTRIRVTRAEQARTSRPVQPSICPGAGPQNIRGYLCTNIRVAVVVP